MFTWKNSPFEVRETLVAFTSNPRTPEAQAEGLPRAGNHLKLQSKNCLKTRGNI